MRRLIAAEIRKIWLAKTFLLLLCVLICANVFLLWMDMKPEGEITRAYHHLGDSLSSLQPDEKVPFIESELERAHALYIIDNIAQSEAFESGKQNTAAREQYSSMFQEYIDEYQSGGGPTYTGTYSGDYRFLSTIQSELNEVSDYEGYLNQLTDKADTLSGISVFAEGDSYDQANISKTAADFAGMRGIRIDYFPQRGLMTALGFSLTDIVLVFALLLIATVLVRVERDNGLLALVRSTPAGKLNTAVAKLAALVTSIFVVVVLLYGVNLMFCAGMYGLGSLTRSIQSVPDLMRSTWKLSVGQYLFLFLLTKWVAAVMTGTLVMLVMLWARRILAGALLALSFLGANLLVRAIIPATSHINVLKYANFVSLLQTNELIGGYRNLYWFGRPVPLLLVECVAAFLFAVGLTAAFCGLFCQGSLKPAKRRGLFQQPAFLKTRTYSTVLRQEAYKLLVLNGALAVLVFFGAYQVYSANTTISYLAPEEIYYRFYMRQVEGRYTRESCDWLKEANDEFEPITSLQTKLDKGDITQDEFDAMISSYDSLQKKYNALWSVFDRVRNLETRPRTQLVYETGWVSLFGIDNQQDTYDTLTASILGALCFCGLFAMEKQTGVGKVLCATPLGRRYTVWRKLSMSSGLCVCLSLLSALPRFWVAIRDYGLGAWTAPIYSIPSYSEAPEIPLFMMAGLFVIARLIAFGTIASVTLALSQRIGNAFGALFCSAVLFALPTLLCIAGIDAAKWASLYAMFHATALFASARGIWVTALYLFACCLAMLICTKYLLRNFGGGEWPRN